jgi:hypothetical protein
MPRNRLSTTRARSRVVRSLLAIAAGSLQVEGMRHEGLFQSLARTRLEGTGQISADRIRCLPTPFRINPSFWTEPFL